MPRDSRTCCWKAWVTDCRNCSARKSGSVNQLRGMGKFDTGVTAMHIVNSSPRERSTWRSWNDGVDWSEEFAGPRGRQEMLRVRYNLRLRNRKFGCSWASAAWWALKQAAEPWGLGPEAPSFWQSWKAQQLQAAFPRNSYNSPLSLGLVLFSRLSCSKAVLLRYSNLQPIPFEFVCIFMVVVWAKCCFL